MNKKYTYGVAALVLIGTTLIGSSLYAADMLPKISNVLTPVGNIQMHRGAENMLTSLSGSVSQEALTELKALMDTHKAKIDALKASGSGTTFDQAAFTALKTEHQTALDALKKKYPELETALKNMK
jgi:hypothetical protein